uniref:Uncharacterized protein n=1 Tax=Arundo donax TaxID=35708 RepID=A0A0A9EK56_ARUDO
MNDCFSFYPFLFAYLVVYQMQF